MTTSCLYHKWMKASRPRSAALTAGPLDLVAWSCTWSNQCLNTLPWSCLKGILPWPIFQFSRRILPSFRVPNHTPESSHLPTSWLGHSVPRRHSQSRCSSHSSSHWVRIQRDIHLVLVSPGILTPLLPAHELSVLCSVSDMLHISGRLIAAKNGPTSPPPLLSHLFQYDLEALPIKKCSPFLHPWILAGLVTCVH